MQKQIKSVFASNRDRVGDGFVIRRPLPNRGLQNLNPFLMLDYAGPTYFPPSPKARGVDEHPHRGFETVSIVFQGELEHRDSAGNRGALRPGDVQWMTAASGLVHEEKHSDAFTREGGTLEMIQLWVNLPAKHKMDPPSYQEIMAADIPVVALPGEAGIVRVIAGELLGAKGAASTHTPMFLFDLRLKAGAEVEIEVPEGATAGVFVRHGKAFVNGDAATSEAELAVLSESGTRFRLRAEAETGILILGGQPIQEPVASYGPFVMNTRQELMEAVMDYESGKMGRLS